MIISRMKKRNILTLGIESSCDETSCAVVSNGKEILSNVIASQADFHAQFGGVVPEIASRMHIDAIVPVIQEALLKADIHANELDCICVTKGPGLVGALLVGITAAKSIAAVTGIPIIGINHIEGHIAANYLSNKDLKPPFICLVASGGHSHVIYVQDYISFKVLARTRDDAAGEAFDKIARIIGLGYPGGPKLDIAAKNGNPEAFNFPRTKFKDSLDFSFSGIKTSAMNIYNQSVMKENIVSTADFSASYQEEIISVLIERTMQAAKQVGCMNICMAGGVSANSRLREKMQEVAKNQNISLTYPPAILCTDNAAMIAATGYYRFINGQRDDLQLNAFPSLSI